MNTCTECTMIIIHLSLKLVIKITTGHRWCHFAIDHNVQKVEIIIMACEDREVTFI